MALQTPRTPRPPLVALNAKRDLVLLLYWRRGASVNFDQLFINEADKSAADESSLLEPTGEDFRFIQLDLLFIFYVRFLSSTYLFYASLISFCLSQ